MKCSPGISNFLEEISSLSHSVVFLYFFALITEEVSLISPCYSFGILHSDAYIFPFLLCFSLLFFSQLFVRPPQIAILLLAFLFHGDDLDPCHAHSKCLIIMRNVYDYAYLPRLYRYYLFGELLLTSAFSSCAAVACL